MQSISVMKLHVRVLHDIYVAWVYVLFSASCREVDEIVS